MLAITRPFPQSQSSAEPHRLLCPGRDLLVDEPMPGFTPAGGQIGSHNAYNSARAAPYCAAPRQPTPVTIAANAPRPTPAPPIELGRGGATVGRQRRKAVFELPSPTPTNSSLGSDCAISERPFESASSAMSPAASPPDWERIDVPKLMRVKSLLNIAAIAHEQQRVQRSVFAEHTKPALIRQLAKCPPVTALSYEVDAVHFKACSAFTSLHGA